MAESRRRGERSQAADRRREAARMRTKTAMHRHPHVGVDALAGEVARHVLHHPRRDESRAFEAAAMREHLIEGGHGARRGEAAAAGNAGAAPGVAVLVRETQLLRAIL